MLEGSAAPSNEAAVQAITLAPLAPPSCTSSAACNTEEAAQPAEQHEPPPAADSDGQQHSTQDPDSTSRESPPSPPPAPPSAPLPPAPGPPPPLFSHPLQPHPPQLPLYPLHPALASLPADAMAWQQLFDYAHGAFWFLNLVTGCAQPHPPPEGFVPWQLQQEADAARACAHAAAAAHAQGYGPFNYHPRMLPLTQPAPPQRPLTLEELERHLIPPVSVACSVSMQAHEPTAPSPAAHHQPAISAQPELNAAEQPPLPATPPMQQEAMPEANGIALPEISTGAREPVKQPSAKPSAKQKSKAQRKAAAETDTQQHSQTPEVSAHQSPCSRHSWLINYAIVSL